MPTIPRNPGTSWDKDTLYLQDYMLPCYGHPSQFLGICHAWGHPGIYPGTSCDNKLPCHGDILKPCQGFLPLMGCAVNVICQCSLRVEFGNHMKIQENNMESQLDSKKFCNASTISCIAMITIISIKSYLHYEPGSRMTRHHACS